MPNEKEDEEQLELLRYSGGNVYWFKHSGKLFGDTCSRWRRHTYATQTNESIPGYMPNINAYVDVGQKAYTRKFMV